MFRHLNGRPIIAIEGNARMLILEEFFLPIFLRIFIAFHLVLYTSYLFHIVENHVVRHAHATTICAVIPRPLSRPQVMILLNRDVINSLMVLKVAHEVK